MSQGTADAIRRRRIEGSVESVERVIDSAVGSINSGHGSVESRSSSNPIHVGEEAEVDERGTDHDASSVEPAVPGRRRPSGGASGKHTSETSGHAAHRPAESNAGAPRP